MGLTIDGDFKEHRSHDGLSPDRRQRSEPARPRSPIWSFLLCVAGGSLAGAIFGASVSTIQETSRFVAETEGKCQTAAGAVGIVDTLYGSSSVKLSFPSGVNASYDFSKLHEVPCSQMAATTYHEEAR